jgi:hypothetical protein
MIEYSVFGREGLTNQNPHFQERPKPLHDLQALSRERFYHDGEICLCGGRIERRTNKRCNSLTKTKRLKIQTRGDNLCQVIFVKVGGDRIAYTLIFKDGHLVAFGAREIDITVLDDDSSG